MALFLKDGVWKDTRTDAAPNEGGFIDDAGQVFDAHGEYQLGTGDPSLIFSGGAAINDPNRSFAPDILVNGSPASNSFYETKGATAPSAEQMAQTYNPALGGDFFTQNATPADTGQGLSGLAGFIRGHGYLVPLALASGGLALEAAGGLGALGGLSTGMVDAAGNIVGGGLEGAAYGGGAAATQALPYTEAFDAANLYSQGLNSAAIEQNLAATGLDSFLSADMASLAAQGLTAEQIASTLAASYTPAELAGTGIQSLNWGANAAQGLTGADALKYGSTALKGISTASSLAKLLSPTSSLGAGSALNGAMQNFAKGQTGVGSAIPGIIRGNQNPFLQTAQQPIRSTSPDLAQLANLLKQG
jgi:hypothetical protein